MTNPLADKAHKRLERMKKQVYKTASPFIPGNRYSWIFGFTELGKAVLYGPYVSDPEAESNAIGLDTYEIFHLATCNTAKASREVKHILIARGEDPDEAMKRLLHKHEDDVERPASRSIRYW